MKASSLLFLLLLPCFAFSQKSNTSDETESLHLNIVEGELKNQWISSLMQDNEGFIWVGTQDGLHKFFEKSTKSYHYNPQKNKSLPANWVRCLTQDSKGIFWIGTQGGGLVRFDQDTGIFEEIPILDNNEKLKGTIIYDIFITSKDELWIESENGLYKKNPDNSFEKVRDSLQDVIVNETDDGKIIIYTERTIFRYNDKTKNLEPLHENIPVTKMFHSGESNFILKIKDSLYTYILGKEPVLLKTPEIIYGLSNIRNNNCYLFGKKYIYKYNILNNTFQKLVASENIDMFQNIQYIFLDKQEILWIGTNNGLYRESISGRIFKEVIPIHARRIIADNDNIIIAGITGLYEHSLLSKNTTQLLNFNIFSVLKTTNGIWAGGMSNLLYHIDNKKNIKSYKLDQDDKKLLKIYGIVQDKNNYLWVSTWEGILLVNLNGEVIKRFTFNSPNTSKDLKALQLHIDRQDNLWVITVGNGIYKIPQVSKISAAKNEFSFEQYTVALPKPKTLNANTLYEIYEADNGDIWFGMDSGINIYSSKNKTFSSLEIGGEYFDKKTMAITIDASGLLWISTIRNGLFVFDPERDRLLNLNTDDGLVSDACLFTSRLFYRDRLYFGTENGVQVIDSKSFKFPEIKSKPIIIDVDLYTSIQDSKSTVEIKKINIKKTDHFEVAPTQSYFTINFASIDYSYPKKLNYYYKLNDEEAIWRETESNLVSFTNLEPGDYTFYLKAAYNIADTTPIAIRTFTIRPYWYNTHLAYSFYILIFISVIIAFYYLKLKQNIASNKLKAATALDQFKTRLYTDISHEFRTPLTLISGPIDNQLSKSEISKKDRKELTLVKQNADRLLSLVGQMLDLSIIDSGQRKLAIKQGNLSILLKQLISAFQYKASEKNITISNSIQNIKNVWFDKDVIEKITSNLLSNAIKYSPKRSTIVFDANNQEGVLVLSVINKSDNVGKKDLSKLFQRFYQDNKLSEGVGVGLALVRELVALSKGTIVANNIDDDRIQFSVSLPINRDAFEDDDIIFDEETIKADETEIQSNKNSEKEKPLVLIVEDEADIRAFIISFLKKDYQIIEAVNGKIGTEKALKEIPDLIISDIMMPEVDGIQLCKTLKTNELTSHIPIILLTAKVAEKSEIEGISTGADAYVTKPFNSETLKVRVQKLIETRRQLQKHFSKTLSINPELAITSTESDFLKRLQAVLDQHITDPEFTSDLFGKLMHMSRTQLHRKLKTITGMSSSEFIRAQRLKLAIGLLKETDATISEIAYQVGFNTPSYFGKCFKEVYNCTPNEYLSKNP